MVIVYTRGKEREWLSSLKKVNAQNAREGRDV